MLKQTIPYFKTSIVTTIVAMLVLSCGKKQPAPAILDPETTPTLVVRNLVSTESINGKRTSRLETPLMEEYLEASQPYREFKLGLKMEFFADDSVTIESFIRADYARYDAGKKLWEGRGNVVAKSLLEEREMYTEQAFYDEVTKKIYTHKNAKVIDRGDVHYGSGFVTDKDFKTLEFKKAHGRWEVPDSLENSNSEPSDSLLGTQDQSMSDRQGAPLKSVSPSQMTSAQPDGLIKGNLDRPTSSSTILPSKNSGSTKKKSSTLPDLPKK